jgi:hypothetical protein
VNRHIGGSRFWQAVGLLAGGMTGISAGLLPGGSFLTLLMFPLVLAGLGAWAGRRLWLASKQLNWNWDRIWAVFGSAGGALLGWGLTAWVSNSSLSAQIYGFTFSLAAGGTDIASNWMIMGVLAGALGGAFAGFFTDLIARIVGLIR